MKSLFLALASAAIMAPAMANQPTVVKLPSGVTIEHTYVSSGNKPTASSFVTVHYEGKLQDGTVFDKSDRKFPVRFNLGQVIPCWTEGLQHIGIGGKATLTCPAKTAYGDRQVGPHITPGSTLFFDVELLNID